VIDDNIFENLDYFGRFFIFYDYLDKKHHEKFIKISRSFENINSAIINDIEDFIIVDGMRMNGRSYLINRDQAKMEMKKLNEKINK